MATGDKIKVGLERFEKFREIKYNEGDYVVGKYNIIYQCIKDMITFISPDEVYITSVDEYFVINENWTPVNNTIFTSWTSGYAYNVGDIVQYLGLIFKKILLGDNGTQPYVIYAGTTWVQIEDWNSVKTYAIGDLVLRTRTSPNNMDFYEALKVNINENPTTSSHWKTIYDPRKKVTWISQTGHGGFAILLNKKLFSTGGSNSSPYWNSVSGRLLNKNSMCGVDNLKQVMIPEDSPIKKAGGFNGHMAYALLENGNLYTWGVDSSIWGDDTPSYSCGNIVEVYDHPTNGSSAVQLTRLYCKDVYGNVYGKGDNSNGSLGLGHANIVTTWTVISALFGATNIWSMGAGADCTVALVNGRILVAGYNAYGQLGTGDLTNRNTFTDVTINWAGTGLPGYDIVDLKVTGGFGYKDDDTTNVSWRSCIIMLITLGSHLNFRNKKIKSCGDNTWGQLGNATTTNSSTPVSVHIPINDLFLITDICAFGGGATTVRALDMLGNVYSWGFNVYGGVGNLSSTSVSDPVIVRSDCVKLHCDGWTSNQFGYMVATFVTTASGQTLGVGNGGSWGSRGDGYLEETTFSFSVVKLPYYDPVIMMGSYTTVTNGRVVLALTKNGNLYAWGYNGYNGVTDMSTSNCLLPVNVNLPDVK